VHVRYFHAVSGVSRLAALRDETIGFREFLINRTEIMGLYGLLRFMFLIRGVDWDLRYVLDVYIYFQ
jgi:hypothetical protein